MRACPAGPFRLLAGSLGAVGQLSCFCPCSQESVTCVTLGSIVGCLRGADGLGAAEEPSGVPLTPRDFSC